jgi:UDP-glucose 4-epimerase
VRDYVHVTDLAAAHVLGLQRLLAGQGNGVFCLGTGRGFSVREVIEASRMVTNREVPVVLGDRRAGDAAALVCSSTCAQTDLGWEPQHSSLRQMIGDAWAWAQKPGFTG